VPVHIHDQPFYAREQRWETLGAEITVAPLRPLVWISITAPEVLAPLPDLPRFPALVDTGFNGALFLREDHLHKRVDVTTLPEQSPGNLRLADSRLESYRRYRARIWMHSFGLDPPLPALDLDISRGVLVWAEPPGQEPEGPEEGFFTRLLRKVLPRGGAEPAPRPRSSPAPQGPSLPTLGAWALRPKRLKVTVDYDLLRLRIWVP
jgi:hypothetical protein